MQYNMQISLFRCNNHTFLSLLVCVHYIIGCNIADTLRRVPLLCAASHIIGNYNYLCSVPLRRALLLCDVMLNEQITTRSIFVL